MSTVCNLPNGSTVAGALTTFVCTKNALLCGMGAVAAIVLGSPLAAIGSAVSAIALASFALLAIIVTKKIASGDGQKTVRQFIREYVSAVVTFIAVVFATIIGKLKNILPSRSQNQNIENQNLSRDAGQEIFGVGKKLMKETLPTIEVEKGQAYYEVEGNLFQAVFPKAKVVSSDQRINGCYDQEYSEEEFNFIYPTAPVIVKNDQPSAPQLNNSDYKQMLDTLNVEQFKELVSNLGVVELNEVLTLMDSTKFGELLENLNNQEVMNKIDNALYINQTIHSSVDVNVDQSVIHSNNTYSSFEFNIQNPTFNFNVNNYYGYVPPVNVYNAGNNNK